MSVRSLNKVMLIGNLTRDPELRYTPSGTAVCSFGLATNRGWTTEAGDKKEETEFHRIVSWNKLAELCSQLLVKGRKVFVEGRLQTRAWTTADNTQRQTTEIVIDDMIVLDSLRRPETIIHPTPKVENDVQVSSVEPSVDVVKTDSSQNQTDTKPKKSSKKADSQEASTAKEDINPDDIPF